MRKNRSLLLLLGSILVGQVCGISMASSAAPECQSFNGNLVLQIDTACSILSRDDTLNRFPDAQFLANLGVPDTCFTGAVSGTIGGLAITATSFSGTTYQGVSPLDDFPDLSASGQWPFSAVTTLVVRAGNTNPVIGRLHFRDIGFINLIDGTAMEQLVATGGSGAYAGVRGTLSITGNEFIGAPVTGTLCR